MAICTPPAVNCNLLKLREKGIIPKRKSINLIIDKITSLNSFDVKHGIYSKDRSYLVQ